MDIPGLPIPAAAAQSRGHPQRAEARRPDPVSPVPGDSPRQHPAEQVIQGELLQSDRARQRTRGQDPFAEVLGRDRHPAFYSRQANDAFVQRRALAAYQLTEGIQTSVQSGPPRIDYFI